MRVEKIKIRSRPKTADEALDFNEIGKVGLNLSGIRF
jgi:hypothetical protein